MFGKRRLQEVLDQGGLKLVDLCRDLRLHPSAATRWGPKVPPYATFYALAMATMTPEQRRTVRVGMEAFAPDSPSPLEGG